MEPPAGPPAKSHKSAKQNQSASRAVLRSLARRKLSLFSTIHDLRLERDQHALVLHVGKLLLRHLDPVNLFEAVSSILWEHTRHDFLTLTALVDDGPTERVEFLDTPAFRGRYRVGGNIPAFLRRAERAIQTQQIDILGPDRIAAMEPPDLAKILQQESIQSICHIPLTSRLKKKPLGVLSLGSREAHHFGPEIIHLLELITPQLALAMDNALAFQEIQALKDKLAEEKLYLEEEVRRDFATGEIIGRSPALRNVLQQIEIVAPSDASVLLLGETGTGKELVARAIHEQSRRQARTFVRLNCSAIPHGLMESELFGHERGAFTGAIARKIGRFELAHQGTLFLDEIGDLPLDLQPKLLRAIQEREFERLGSNQTLRVDVRLIAATHRDLVAMVKEGTFRSDLFYRLHVFPIQIPALRDRKEDIPSLVRYFTQKFAKAMDKRIERIPSATMDALVAWPWPGNIRELHNLIERAVIISPGEELRVPLAELKTRPEPESASSPQTLEEMERKGILAALQECKGIVGGPNGAAARLGLKRTTLHSKMRKLGIERD